MTPSLRLIGALAVELVFCGLLCGIGAVLFRGAGAAASLIALLVGSASLGALARRMGRPRGEPSAVVFASTLVAISQLARLYWLDYAGGPPAYSLAIAWESVARGPLVIAFLLAATSLAGWCALARTAGTNRNERPSIVERPREQERMAQVQPEQDEWGEWPIRLDDARLSMVRAALEETPVILEHRYYRGSSAPKRLVFDEFEALAEYLRTSTRPGDAIWMWRYSDLCREVNAVAWGKISDGAGRVPRRGSY